MKHQFTRVVFACVCLLASGETLLAQSDPQKGSTDIDRTVGYPMAQVRDAARQALTNYRCNFKKAAADYFECVRDRNVGLGSGGGEKVTVQLGASGSETRVEIKTGKEFWFQIPVGQKNWSAAIFEAMMTALEQPQPLYRAPGARVRVTAPGAARPQLTGNPVSR